MRPITIALAEFIATVGYIGRIKFAPGTWGSLVAFPLAYLALWSLLKTRFIINLPGFLLAELEIITILLFFAGLIILLFIIGVIVSNIYIMQHKVHDPKEIVIDEVVGQMLALLLTSASNLFIYNSTIANKLDPILVDITCYFILPFILFRAFDIIKPWPINWLDKNIKGGLGVMIDDVAAAVFASVTQYAIIITVISWAS